MNAEQIIELIRSAEKKTPVKVYLWEKEPTSFPGAKEFPCWTPCQDYLRRLEGGCPSPGRPKRRPFWTWWWRTRPGIPLCPSWTRKKISTPH